MRTLIWKKNKILPEMPNIPLGGNMMIVMKKNNHPIAF
jgi:hypothetical protein